MRASVPLDKMNWAVGTLGRPYLLPAEPADTTCHFAASDPGAGSANWAEGSIAEVMTPLVADGAPSTAASADA